MVQSATAALVAFGKYGEEGPVAAQLPAGCVCVKHVQLAVRVSSVCVCLLWCHSLFGGRSAEVPAPGCKGAGSTVWEWGAHAYVMEMVQTQEHEAVLWLVTRQHCRSSPFGSLGSFRAQEDAYLCWGDPSCGEEGSK